MNIRRPDNGIDGQARSLVLPIPLSPIQCQQSLSDPVVQLNCLPGVRHWPTLAHHHNEVADDVHHVHPNNDIGDLPEFIGGEEAQVG